MSKQLGFSLSEVLIALCIFSFSSLAMFKHNWQLSKTLQYQNQQLLAQQILDDATEVSLAGFAMPTSLQNKISNRLHATFSHKFYNNIDHLFLNFHIIDGKSYIDRHLERKV